MVCTTRLSKQDIRQLRQVYEAFLGDRLSDTSWRNTQKFILDSGLSLDANNLREYAQLRKCYPKMALTPLEFRAILATFANFKKLIPELISGQEFLNLLRSQGIEPDISTIYRWFQKAGNQYNRKSWYSTEVIFSVAYRAVIWKFKDIRSNDNVKSA